MYEYFKILVWSSRSSTLLNDTNIRVNKFNLRRRGYFWISLEKQQSLWSFTAKHTSMLLSTFGIHIFKTQLLFCSFDVSLIIDYQVGRLRSLFDTVHPKFLAKYHYLNMMYFLYSINEFGTKEGVIFTKTLKISWIFK